jgi:hypothetical protein
MNPTSEYVKTYRIVVYLLINYVLNEKHVQEH